MRLTSLVTCLAAMAILGGASTAQAKTVWLCNGTRSPDLCKPNLTTTLLSNGGATQGLRPVRREQTRFDCFYIYPTVSDDKSANSDLSIDPEERSIALYQAARYSQVCRVFAPMYRQVTLTQLLKGTSTITPQMSQIAYASALSGWKDYLRTYNKGRPFVLIGHSQGSFTLRKLISTQIDPNRRLRRLMVSAILLGGNVLVKTGKDVGGDFKHIHGCHSASTISCVIAFSTFNAPVPAELAVRPALGRAWNTTAAEHERAVRLSGWPPAEHHAAEPAVRAELDDRQGLGADRISGVPRAHAMGRVRPRLHRWMLVGR